MCDGVELDRPQSPQVRTGQRQVPRGLDYRGRTLVLYRRERISRRIQSRAVQIGALAWVAVVPRARLKREEGKEPRVYSSHHQSSAS